MPSQIIFVIDLDQCLPLQDLSEEDPSRLEILLSGLKRCCLRVLCLFSSYDHLSSLISSKIEVPYFSYRFYSSTGYFSIPDQLNPSFQELSEESYADLDFALSSQFDKYLSQSNKDWGDGLKYHLQSSKFTPFSSLLKKTLEEIVILYNWDRPMLHSPVKSLETPSKNILILITKFPSSKKELNHFLGCKSGNPTVKEITDHIFSRNVINKFKENDGVSVYALDTSKHFNHHSDIDPDIKDTLNKVFRQMRGASFLWHDSSNLDEGFYQHLLYKHSKNNKPLLKPHVASFELPNRTKDDVKLYPLEEESSDFPYPKSFKILALTSSKSFSLINSKYLAHYRIRPVFLDIVPLLNQMESMSLIGIVLVDEKRTGILFYSGTISVLSSDSKPLERKDAESRSTTGGTPFHLEDLHPWRIPTDLKEIVSKLKNPEPFSLMNTLNNVSKTKSTEPSAIKVQTRSSSKRPLTRHCSEPIQVTAESSTRAAKLLRLGNKKNKEKNLQRSLSAKTPSTKSLFSDDRNSKKILYEKELEGSENLLTDLLAKLLEFQVNCICDGDDASVSALAEVTVGSILKYLRIHENEEQMEFLTLFSTNFLVDPLTISRRKTSKIKSQRLRDHKIQAAFRMELYWLLPSEDAQSKFENEILVHLRQMSIWGDPSDMTDFLNDTLTPTYTDRQPELLCSIFDELNLPKTEYLQGIFSPKSCSSTAPSSVVSSVSDLNYVLNSKESNPSNKNVTKIKKLRRPNSFDSGSTRRQIIVGKEFKSKAKTLAKKPTSNLQVNPSTISSPSAKGRSGLHRAKRNLSFDSLKSPKKTIVTPKKDKTPVKSLPSYSKWMTPNKTHQIYAPETPETKKRFKSDGNTSIGESPYLGPIKYSKTTPRRAKASLTTRRKTSFYSGSVSRNILKAEEALSVSRIQTHIPSSQSSAFSGGPESFFPHLSKKRLRTADDEDLGESPKSKVPRRDLYSSPMKTNASFSFKTPVKNGVSPSKRVQFNMSHQPPTPSNGTPAKTILKTPSKNTPIRTKYLSPKLSYSTPSKCSPKAELKKALLQSPATKSGRCLFGNMESPLKVSKTLLNIEPSIDLVKLKTKEDENKEDNSSILKESRPSPEKEDVKVTASSSSSSSSKPLRELSGLSDGLSDYYSATSSVESKRTPRNRKTTHRLGIDDVCLGSSNRIATPKVLEFEEINDENRDSNKRKGKTLKRTTKIIKLTESNEPDAVIMDLPETLSPKKTVTWTVASSTESPKGEIKLKIKRTPVPLTTRISRSLASEIGVSPDRLRMIQEESTPNKDSKDQKLSPLTNLGLQALTTSPLVDKRSSGSSSTKKNKVSKRLYVD